jgi:hypothetical protein
MKKLIIICLFISSCSLLLDPGQKWGYDYCDIELHYRTKVGGIWIYYLENDGRSARIAIENKFNEFWITEGWEHEQYSYEAGWVKYHVAQIRREKINIGWKKP